MSNASRLAGRKEKKARAPRAPRRIKAESPKYQTLPSAFAEGKFLGAKGQTVHALRYRDRKDSWHKCTVMNTDNGYIQLWDELLGQWFCFDVPAPTLPDIRFGSASDASVTEHVVDLVVPDEEPEVGTPPNPGHDAD